MFQEFQNMIEKVFYELITQCVKLLDLPKFPENRKWVIQISQNFRRKLRQRNQKHNDKHLGITPLY